MEPLLKDEGCTVLSSPPPKDSNEGATNDKLADEKPSEQFQPVFDEKPPQDSHHDSSRDSKPSPDNSKRCGKADFHPNTSRVSDDKLDYWNVVPTEILEKILLLSVETAEKPLSTYHFLSRTCSRFKTVLQRQRHVLLPSVHIRFTDDEAKKLDSYNGKIKVSIRKIIKVFGVACSAILKLPEIIGDKKWKSAWLVLEQGKYSTYFVHRYFWKCSQKAATMPILIKDDELVSNKIAITTEVFWLSNELYNLKNDDDIILRSETKWMNDRIMDAAQKLICKALGDEEGYQSVLNAQHKGNQPFHPVNQEYIQLIHDGSNHWFLSFCSNGRVQICDSLNAKLNRVSSKCVQALYKIFVDCWSGRVLVSFLPVQKQTDSCNCGPFAVAFAAEILDAKSPIEARFDVKKMRGHLRSCLIKKQLDPFPKV